MQKTSVLSLQQWGNSLAVRIPAVIARLAHFRLGQQVELSVENDSVIIRTIGEPKLSLAQKLAKFDQKQHAGEALMSPNFTMEER